MEVARHKIVDALPEIRSQCIIPVGHDCVRKHMKLPNKKNQDKTVEIEVKLSIQYLLVTDWRRVNSTGM